MERYEISECNEYDIMPYGYTVWAVGNDSAGIPYSRQVGWYATREEAEQDISNHSQSIHPGHDVKTEVTMLLSERLRDKVYNKPGRISYAAYNAYRLYNALRADYAIVLRRLLHM